MTHITDALQARRIAAYRAAVETLPEDKQELLERARDKLASEMQLAAEKPLALGDALRRADAVIAEVLWRAR